MPGLWNKLMPTGKTCGNCLHFTRMRDSQFLNGRRNGICDVYDYNCHSDSSYAKKCPKYKRHNPSKDKQHD